MTTLLISLAAFVGVTALVGVAAMLLRGGEETAIEDRLSILTGAKKAANPDAVKESVLIQPLGGSKDIFAGLLERLGSLSLLFEQADTKLTPTKFFVTSGGMAVFGAAMAVFSGMGMAAAPLAGLFMAFLPLMWLMFRRKRRFAAFGRQLPNALELISRALRAGHSLASGFSLVASEMHAPIGVEFGRVFEEQNLGIPMDEALNAMTDRIPNLDLRFFCTALILQRQTGGDLAEILDKIGHLIRERIQIFGQVQALTGEGRLSGIVLLALPPVLFLAVYKLNPDYIMALFTDPMGKQMLAGGIVLQFLGAVVIKKIINIRV